MHLVACVYYPPGSCSNPFYDEFYTLVEFLSSTNSYFIICGDFNIHIDTTSRDSVNSLNIPVILLNMFILLSIFMAIP